MFIPDDYIHDTSSHCSCLVVERVSTNFSDNPRIVVIIKKQQYNDAEGLVIRFSFTWVIQ